MNQDISILSNTIPVIHRDEALAGVKAGIGSRPGPWKVSLHEPRNASRWVIHIEGPNGYEHRFVFNANEQIREHISRTIYRELTDRFGTWV